MLCRGRLFAARLRRREIRRIIVYCMLLLLAALTAYVRIETPPASRASLNPPSSQLLIPSVPSAGTNVVPLPVEPPPHLDIEEANTGHDALSSEEREKTSVAVSKMKAGDFGGAAEIFTEIAQRDSRALAAAGICYFNLNDYAQALSYLKKAVEYDGNDFTSLKFLAFAYYQTDNPAGSLESAETALRLKRDDNLEALRNRLKREIQAQEGYSEESSSHFTIYYDGYPHGKLNRQVTDMLEDAYRTVGKELNYFPPGAVTVILYSDRNFFDVTRTPAWTAGYYDSKIRIPIRGAEEQSASLKRVLFHEYTHAAVRSITKTCPLWINEGLAEYFSSGPPRKVGQIIPLRSLETTFSSLSASDVNIAYQESCSAVSCLIDKYGMYRVREMLLALSRGEDVNLAFADAFGITYEKFLAAWH